MAGYTPAGLAGNQPSSVATPTSYNFLGASELNGFAVLKPDVNPELTKRYGYQDDIISLYEKLGFRRRTSNSSIFRHYEEERLHAPIVMAATTAGGANAAVDIAIASADVLSIGQTEPYIGSGTLDAVIPIVGDVGYFANNVEAIVTEVDATIPQFTACPITLGENIPTILEGDKFTITSNAVGEASDKRGSTTSRILYYQNNMQNFRADHVITGDARGEAVWTQFDGKYGAGNYWYYYDMDRVWKKHKQAVAHGCLFGKDVTNTVLAGIAGFETVKKTKGVVPTVKDSGILEDYVAGSMTMLDLENLTDSLTEQMAPNDYMALCSQGWRRDLNKLGREGDGVDFNQDSRSSVIFANFNGGVQAIDFDIDAVKVLGYNFHVKSQRAFSDPTQLGNVTEYNNFCLGLPMGEANIYEEIGGSYVSTPSASVVVKGDGMGGDRSMIETMRGIKETGKDQFEHTLLTECGIEMYAANHAFVMTGDATV